MTRIIGVATDAESGAPIVGRRVDAYVTPRGADMDDAPLDPPFGVDRTRTDDSGQWQLNLRQTTGADPFYIIRVWQHSTLIIDVPSGPGPFLVDDVTIELPTSEADLPPSWSLPDYVRAAEKAAPSGVATLGSDGKLTPSQRWTVSGGGGSFDGALSYTHQQNMPSSVWLVSHDLSFVPSGVVVIDHIGNRHFPDISYPNASTVRLDFVSDVRGAAYLS